MRLIWNAGAAIAVTTFLTFVASAAAGPGHPAEAAPVPAIKPVSDMPHRHYTGLNEHFAAANTSHDGKLTLAQAVQAGWSRVVRHFTDIDSGHLGYVTVDQIHAYNLAHRHSHKAGGDA